jgi:hypothetical protein
MQTLNFFSFIFQSKTFPITLNGRPAGLTLDWFQGFTLTFEGATDPVWRYKFHQLRGSSDDGKSKLKLHFQEHDSIAIETKVYFYFVSICFVYKIKYYIKYYDY